MHKGPKTVEKPKNFKSTLKNLRNRNNEIELKF